MKGISGLLQKDLKSRVRTQPPFSFFLFVCFLLLLFFFFGGGGGGGGRGEGGKRACLRMHWESGFHLDIPTTRLP